MKDRAGTRALEQVFVCATLRLALRRASVFPDKAGAGARHADCSTRRAMKPFLLLLGLLACGSSAGSDNGVDGGGTVGCRSDTQCDHASFQMCARVEDPICGGIAPPDHCSVDKDCADAGANEVCVNSTCGAHLCQTRCSGDSCGSPALTCSATSGKCEAKACSLASDCPADFACDTSHTCSVKACTSDGDCSGACVNGRCSSAAGVCRTPAA
jgi:hypothetical protein